nr:unnamed protein product [Spirometra erinaceieuropaei]
MSSPGGHLRTNCSTRTTPAAVSSSNSASSSTPLSNVGRLSEPPLPSSSSIFSTSATVASATPMNTTHNPDTPTNANTTTTTVNASDENLVYTCPQCDRAFASNVGLVGHLRIRRTETGEPKPGAPIYTLRFCLHCPHCPRIFTHRMGLFGHMRIDESVTDRSLDVPSTYCTPTIPSLTRTPSPSAPTISTSTTATTTETDTDTADVSYPHCNRIFTSHIGLVGQLRIHRRETGQPVPGASSCTSRILLHCPYCIRTFIHCMGLLDHVRIHENLRQTNAG